MNMIAGEDGRHPNLPSKRAVALGSTAAAGLTAAILVCTSARSQEAPGAQGQPPAGSANQSRAQESQGLVGYDRDGNLLSVDDRGITFATPNKTFQLRIGGRVELDFGTARVRGPRFGLPFNDSFEPRRTFFESYFTFYDSVELALQYDLSDDTRPINDLVLAYRGLNPFVFSIGSMKEPFSLDQLTSDTNLLFTERSLADPLVPGRNLGFAVGAHGDAWTLTGGVFGGNANTGVGDNGVSGTVRAIYVPIHTKDEVAQIGVAGSFRSLGSSGSVSINNRPESFLFTTALVNTGTLRSAETIGRVGVEAAYQTGPLRFQGEYILTDVGRSGGQPTGLFHGGYVEAGYTLNGTGRTYTLAPKYGTGYSTFGAPPIPDALRISKGGPGVFELGSRVSFLDLTNRGIAGGKQVDYGFALNWYPEKNIKVAANYIRAHAYDSPAVRRDVDADIFVGRFQLYW